MLTRSKFTLSASATQEFLKHCDHRNDGEAITRVSKSSHASLKCFLSHRYGISYGQTPRRLSTFCSHAHNKAARKASRKPMVSTRQLHELVIPNRVYRQRIRCSRVSRTNCAASGKNRRTAATLETSAMCSNTLNGHFEISPDTDTLCARVQIWNAHERASSQALGSGSASFKMIVHNAQSQNHSSLRFERNFYKCRLVALKDTCLRDRTT